MIFFSEQDFCGDEETNNARISYDLKDHARI